LSNLNSLIFFPNLTHIHLSIFPPQTPTFQTNVEMGSNGEEAEERRETSVNIILLLN
jgi:hypothetical protein